LFGGLLGFFNPRGWGGGFLGFGGGGGGGGHGFV
jgi:hypothetical protein